MALRDAHYFVDGLHPGGGKTAFRDNRIEYRAERFAKAQDAKKKCIDRLRFSCQERAESGSAFLGYEVRIHQESDELVPGEVVSRRGKIREIQGQAASDEVGRGIPHITSKILQTGYSRIVRGSKRNQELRPRMPRILLQAITANLV